MAASVEECPVCMEPLKSTVVLACKHCFCFPCLKEMQARKAFACPLCRAESAIIPDLKTRCPRKGKDGVSLVQVKRRRATKRRKVSQQAITAIVLSDNDPSDDDVIPRARCEHCEEIHDLNYLQLHSSCPSHLICARCAYIPRAIGISTGCIVCTMHELNMDKPELTSLLAQLTPQAAVV